MNINNILMLLIILAIIGFVFFRLWRTNMDVPDSAEREVSGDDWNENNTMQAVIYIRPGIGHNGGPPFDPSKE